MFRNRKTLVKIFIWIIVFTMALSLAIAIIPGALS
jgi:preprotein translocase subunit SecE